MRCLNLPGALLLVLLTVAPAHSAPDPQDMQPIGPVQSWEADPRGVTLHCQDQSTVRLQVLASDLMRVRAAFQKPLPAADHSWAVSRTDWPAVPFKTLEAGNDLRVVSSRCQAVIHKSPLRIEFQDLEGHVLSGDAAPMSCDLQGKDKSQLFDPESGPAVGMTKKLDLDEHFYGLGEKASRLDKRRGFFTNWNSDTARYKEDTDPLYQTIPFYVGLIHDRAYGLFFDNSYRSYFDMGHTNQDHIAMVAEGGELNYYFFYGPKMAKVVERYTELTGRMPMPPRWALGNQACRYSYYPDTMVERVAREYREHDLPLDVIHLDIHYMQDYRVFTWDRSRFPDPARLTRSLAQMGVRAINIVDPGVKYQPSEAPPAAASAHPELDDQSQRYYAYDQGVANDFFVKRADGRPMITRVWPGESLFVDYTKPEARKWWGDLHKAYTDQGIAGIWNDMNEPADFVDQTGGNQRDGVYEDNGEHTRHAKNRNVFGQLMGRATFEGLSRLRPNERPFVITRAAYAGQQRYTAMWTGDTRSSWDALFLSVPMLQNLGLSGETFVGGDIGGYSGHCDGEFLVRSYQLSFLVPFCRNHKEIDGYDQEPWRFGPYYEGIIRKYLKLRYQLLPYLYATMETAHRTGLPLLRATLLYDQTDPQLYALDDQLMVGDDLLLAPVVNPNQEHRRVYLPKGQWYDFWTGQKHEGKQFVLRATPLETVPLYVRAGAILPMAPPSVRTDDTLKGPLTLKVFPDANGEAHASLYEDDGHSLDYTRGSSARRDVSLTRGGLRVGAWKGGYHPAPRSYRVVLGGKVIADWLDDGQEHLVALGAR